KDGDGVRALRSRLDPRRPQARRARADRRPQIRARRARAAGGEPLHGRGDAGSAAGGSSAGAAGVSARRAVAAELTWVDGALQPGVAVWIDADGRIARIGAAAEATSAAAAPGGDAPPVELLLLPRVALLPGFVNAHSHAFQRALRGQGERFPGGTQPGGSQPGGGAGTFWTWREAMYALVESLTPERLFDATLRAYREMRRAGITCVGEFHYLHHSAAGPDFVGDEAVLAAAAEAGIRLVLLQAYYKTGGVGSPLQGAQRRFETTSLGG